MMTKLPQTKREPQIMLDPRIVEENAIEVAQLRAVKSDLLATVGDLVAALRSAMRTLPDDADDRALIAAIDAGEHVLRRYK